MIRYYKYFDLVTPSGGSVQWNTEHISGDIVTIHVKPLTSTTSFNLQITDPDGLIIYCTQVVHTGELVVSYDAEVVNEILTMTISSASADEEFYCAIRYRQDIRGR